MIIQVGFMSFEKLLFYMEVHIMNNKKIVAGLLALSFVFGGTILPNTVVGNSVISASAAVTSGTCGKNASWTLDDEGTLTISGTGETTSSQFYNNSEIKKSSYRRWYYKNRRLFVWKMLQSYLCRNTG